jgi:hypothetical protein
MSDSYPVYSPVFTESLAEHFEFGFHSYLILLISAAIIIAAICALFVSYYISNKVTTPTCVDDSRKNYLLYTALLFNSISFAYLFFLAWKLFKSGNKTYGVILVTIMLVLIAAIIIQAISISKIDPSTIAAGNDCLDNQIVSSLKVINVISIISGIVLGFVGVYVKKM